MTLFLSRAARFLKEVKVGKFLYVPGEHDVIGDGSEYLKRFGKGTKGEGWYSFDHHGAHFVGLVNVAGEGTDKGLGILGNEQLDWLKDDVAGLAASTPVVVFGHVPLWAVYPQWGWGTQDGQQALGYLKSRDHHLGLTSPGVQGWPPPSSCSYGIRNRALTTTEEY